MELDEEVFRKIAVFTHLSLSGRCPSASCCMLEVLRGPGCVVGWVPEASSELCSLCFCYTFCHLYPLLPALVVATKLFQPALSNAPMCPFTCPHSLA
jgi:hypothetical protein